MKTKFESVIHAARHSFGGIVSAITVILISSTAHAQNMYVTDIGNGNIYEFTTNGTRSTFASDLSEPIRLAFNSAGNLFELDSVSGNIYEFTTNGTRSTFASSLNSPRGLAFDSAGDLFVADTGSKNIYEFTTNGTRSTFASGLTGPLEPAFSAGNLFLADAGTGFTSAHIYEYTLLGARSTIASVPTNPYGLAFDSAGDLFVTDVGDNGPTSGNIYEFTNNGVTLSANYVVFASGLNFPEGLAFDSAGNLLEADGGSGNIYEFTTNGTRSTFATGLNHPSGIAFGASPVLKQQITQYTVDWFKIAGGGGTSTNNIYSITGTVGDPDAGGTMTNGIYSATGGFWSLISVVQTAGAPPLALTHFGNSVKISWLASSAGFILQQNSNLGTTNWTTSGYTIFNDGTYNSITIASPTGNLFFRLKQ